MIPEDELIAVRGVVLGTPLNIAREVIRIGHRSISGVLDKTLDAPVYDLIDLIYLAADDIVAPAAAAAGIDQQIDLLAKVCRGHLLKVAGAHSAAGLQIRAAQVDHDGDIIRAVSLDRGELLSRSRRNSGVDFCLGSVPVVPSGGECSVPAVGTACVVEILVSRAGGIGLIDIPVVTGGAIAAAAASASEQSAQRASASQECDQKYNDQGKSSHAASVPLSAAGTASLTGTAGAADRACSESFSVHMHPSALSCHIPFSSAWSVVLSHHTYPLFLIMNLSLSSRSFGAYAFIRQTKASKNISLQYPEAPSPRSCPSQASWRA